MAAQRREFFSLRAAGRILGLSTQPVRDWVRLKQLRRDGPRAQMSRRELERFIGWLESRAEPFPTENYVERFMFKTGRLPSPFAALHNSEFLWPKGRAFLTPRELSALIGCHPSLITKAIHHYQPRLGRSKSRFRWEISRRRWQNVFFYSRIARPRMAALPRQPLFSTREAADALRRWGRPDVTVAHIRGMIQTGELEGPPRPAGKRKWLVTRKSLEKIRKKLRITA